MAKQPQKRQEPETTGHEWDGIREYNNPLPRWWLWVFYATIVWGIWYTIAYPAWPGIKGATEGYLGWSSRAQLAQELAEAEASHAAINQKLASVELTEIGADPELANYATSAGGAVFRTWCAQCHGSGAQGGKGYPNLLDDDWLWGGTIEDIYITLKHGIRSPDDEDTRFSEMPAFGEMLDEEQIDQVVNHVLKISGQAPRDPAAAEAGAEVFADNCAACHGDDGTGDRSVGAPNLTDAVWLYGGDYDTIRETVTNGRRGVMPSWNTRLSEAEIRSVATYVHQLGGGE